MSIQGLPEDVVTVEEFTAFRDRVVKLRTAFDNLGRGAQQRAAYDCRVSASRVSGVLNARYYDLPCLDALETWLETERYANRPIAAAV